MTAHLRPHNMMSRGLRHRWFSPHATHLSCLCAALQPVRGRFCSMVVETAGDSEEERGKRDRRVLGSRCRSFNHLMFIMFALYFVLCVSGLVSATRETRRCTATGELYLNETQRTISRAPGGRAPGELQTVPNWISSSIGISGQRHKTATTGTSAAVIDKQLPVRVRSRRSGFSSGRRTVRHGGRRSTVVAAVVPSHYHEGIVRTVPTSVRSSLAKINLDFDRSIGDRLLVRDDEGVMSSSHPPLKRLTAVDPTVIGELSLGACRIQTVPHKLLTGMYRLERLALWANEIERIPRGMFDDTLRLRELLLWNNRLDRLDPDTLVPSLTSFAAGGLTTPPSVGPVSSLQVLDLDRNRISKIGPPSSSRNHDGSEINDQHWRRFSELRTLRLSGNRIESIVAGSFRGLTGLQSLTLDGNGLAFINPESFSGLPSLVRLSLGDNAIVFVPDGLFANLARLLELSLARNLIERVWSRTFVGLRSLRRLDLTGNRISQLPDDMFGPSTTPQLSSLLLDDNRLRTLKRCVFPPPRPGQLPTIDRRRPTQTGDETDPPLPFPVQSLTMAPRRTLSLIGNSGMLCDCRLTWLAQIVESGSLRTIWGSCDVHQLHHVTSASEISSQVSSSSFSDQLPAHHHASPSFATTVPTQIPIQTAIFRGLLDSCPPTNECRT